jgi:hypothetical protein
MEFRTSIPKTIGLACLGIVMVAVSYFAATHASGYKTVVLSWFGVPFFTLAVVLICVQLFRRGPSIVMNAEGIRGPKMGSVPLEWSDIAAVSVGQIRRQKFLCLWLRDQDAYVARLPAARRLAAKGNIALGFPATSLSFNGLEPGLEQALEYALRYVPKRANG